MRPLSHSYFELPAADLAPKLLGKIVRKGACAGIIVETEAYATDAASHAFRITPRSAVMRDTYGYWYVYFTYGIHWCANVTCDKYGTCAVLIRAVEPIEGIPIMKRRRGTDVIENLCSGPARFAQAFGITGADSGKPMGGNCGLYDAPEILPEHVVISKRIGITKDTHLPWRFHVRDSPFASR